MTKISFDATDWPVGTYIIRKNESHIFFTPLEWISCAERMPETDDYVLCKDAYNASIHMLFLHEKYWDYGDYCSGIPQEYITHWMPLDFLKEIE